jgi:hypothetical protein
VSVNDLSVGRNRQEVLRVLDALQTDELCPCNWQKGGSFIAAVPPPNHAPTTQALVGAFGPELSVEQVQAGIRIAATVHAVARTLGAEEALASSFGQSRAPAA